MAYKIEIKRAYLKDCSNRYRVEHLTEAKAFIAQVMDLAEYATDELEITIRKTSDADETGTN